MAINGKTMKKHLNGKTDGHEIYDYVQLDDLPKLSELNSKVQKIVETSSWWDMHGRDLVVILIAIVAVLPSLVLMQYDNTFCFSLGLLIYGICHAILAAKGAHSGSHGAFSTSPMFNKFLKIFCTELAGSFSEVLGTDLHVKIHHPHTNIIGLGDSSSWKSPLFPAHLYMFIYPLFVPIMTPFVSVAGLWKQWSKLVRYLVVSSLGLTANFFLLMDVSGFSFVGAVITTLLARMLLVIPFVHVNIFQHIGLPMYSKTHRPKRIYQMSTGCLNLPRNPILEVCFGHSLISCHVEHHLFPTLSDNMCLKIKPAVSKFLKERGLPYKEDTYMGRLKLFLGNYDDWMVKAPPITHFVGIQ